MIHDIFGNEFIFIENRFHPEDGFSFNLKILDAINSIRNGYGDCIVRNNIRSDLTRSYSPIDLYDYYLNPFINNIYVILYKDRTVGDNIREDFLNKLKYDDYIEGYFPVINNNDEPLIIDRSAQKCYPFKFIIDPENSYLENGILKSEFISFLQKLILDIIEDSYKCAISIVDKINKDAKEHSILNLGDYFTNPINSIENIRDYLIKNYFISSIKGNKIELDTNQIFNNCFRLVQYIWPSDEGER